MNTLRQQLVETALAWEKAFCNAPAITSAVSELDAALLVGLTYEQYSDAVKGTTAVTKGSDFVFEGTRYQVKANRPSGKPGSHVTNAGLARNYEWDRFIWILYNQKYELLEAWQWEVDAYRRAFEHRTRVGPDDYRKGKKLT
jgi:hypothetical protein